MPDSLEHLNDGRRYEGQGVLDRALESYKLAVEASTDAAALTEALTHKSRVHRCRSEWELALTDAREAQTRARAAQLSEALIEATIAEGNVLMCRGDFQPALEIFRAVLDGTTNARVRGIALKNIGSILWQQGQLGAAERAISESYGCFNRAGYALGEAMALNDHGRIALERGDLELANRLLTHALEAARSIDDAELIALAKLNYAETLNAQKDHRHAEEQASTALGYFTASGNRWREIECLRLIGTINEQLGDCESAERCWARALGIAEEIGAKQELRLVRDHLNRLPGRPPSPSSA
jgi:tetratricopeptide (TPR) repeat protein